MCNNVCIRKCCKQRLQTKTHTAPLRIMHRKETPCSVKLKYRRVVLTDAETIRVHWVFSSAKEMGMVQIGGH